MIQTRDILVDAVRDVFGTMSISDVVPDASTELGEGIRVLSMSQEFSGAVRGALVVSGRPRAVAVIYERLLGAPIEESRRDELCDALGELLNMVGGLCKRQLAADGIEVRLSLPQRVDAAAGEFCLVGQELQLTQVGFELQGLERRLLFQLALDRRVDHG